jgi:glutamyl-tRNA synthetase
MHIMVRTRFAPSPTGFLHIGGARTALFCWAYARRHGGTFILRVEDTDLERSTPEAVKAIIDGMNWLGLHPDEGPFFQMQRMDRYREVIQQMLAASTAYHCYSSPEELDQMREAQRARGEKPRYDGRWRPERLAPGTQPPAGVKPVVRFKNPTDGVVAWEDAVKGRIEFANAELDDLIIARSDGTPTYNFCVVVDDWDMRITHVLRGDDHVNNTPRQINILRALGAELPVYGHLSMILGDDGQKLSKRHGAVSVMEYPADGYLRDSVLNYLARLGWSHGDDEVFSMEQFCQWFDLDHITPSAAQFNTEKLRWLNQEYLKKLPQAELYALLKPFLDQSGIAHDEGKAIAAADLYRERVHTLNELAEAIRYFFQPTTPESALVSEHLNDGNRPALAALLERLKTVEWTRPALAAESKAVVGEFKLKMPQVMMPLRVLLTGRAQTPSVDAVMEVLGREVCLQRLAAGLT